MHVRWDVREALLLHLAKAEKVLNTMFKKGLDLVFLMLIPPIIGVLFLYHLGKYLATSIYANIKNITFSVSN